MGSAPMRLLPLLVWARHGCKIEKANITGERTQKNTDAKWKSVKLMHGGSPFTMASCCAECERNRRDQ